MRQDGIDELRGDGEQWSGAIFAWSSGLVARSDLGARLWIYGGASLDALVAWT
jgi:hypothetical protein